MDYQLVIQSTSESLKSIDKLIELEEKILEAVDDLADIGVFVDATF